MTNVKKGGRDDARGREISIDDKWGKREGKGDERGKYNHQRGEGKQMQREDKREKKS